MKLLAGLAFALAVTGCTGHTYLAPNGRLPLSHELAYTQSDSSCDTAGARERSDPASPCILANRKPAQ